MLLKALGSDEYQIIPALKNSKILSSNARNWKNSSKIRHVNEESSAIVKAQFQLYVANSVQAICSIPRNWYRSMPLAHDDDLSL
jgi:hypothetical protein